MEENEPIFEIKKRNNGKRRQRNKVIKATKERCSRGDNEKLCFIPPGSHLHIVQRRSWNAEITLSPRMNVWNQKPYSEKTEGPKELLSRVHLTCKYLRSAANPRHGAQKETLADVYAWNTGTRKLEFSSKDDVSTHGRVQVVGETRQKQEAATALRLCCTRNKGGWRGGVKRE